ncbi:S-adenosyl-L-methionine-dependent methyltransferase [Westerdykella ornata]|uniref:S-adenosyl-L-methionine-dependent methyltransferase n=1 Tax=Westerdykella ornata TaxID=318751 RepID=A0A6A6JR09_WESOR|nr:S-adenosyl-L-methionine-dependent methyltransferase [Westerdykella ornata]KAF2278705.1 S-adenosyl-L-methionine-dependent methyltransferase [Westerdykella ornata]
MTQPPPTPNGLNQTLLATITSLENLAYSTPYLLHDKDHLRKRLYNAVHKLLPEIETPTEMAQRLLYTPCEMMGAKIGIDMGVFEILAKSEKPLSTEEVARLCDVEMGMTVRLLRFLGSLGMVREMDGEEDGQFWGPSNRTRNLAMREIAAGVNHKHDNVMPAWHALPSWLRRRGYTVPIMTTDTPFAQGHGVEPQQSFYDWLQERPWNANEFNLFMRVHRLGVQSWMDLEERYAFVDVGGGIGLQSKALVQRYPNTFHGKIILQDLPEVIAKAHTENSGINVMAVDFFKSQPVTNAKIYYLRSILRNWPDPQALLILSHIHAAMSSSSHLIIDDIVLSDKNASKYETQLDMTMLAMLNGQARTESHFRQLLEEAGLCVDKVLVYESEGREAVVVARKA